MEIVLVVAVLAVGAAVLFVTATLGGRTRRSTAPLIDAAVREISGRVEAATAELRRELRQSA